MKAPLKSPAAFGKFMVEYFAEHKRDFPWRRAEVQCDPYAVWISEVMLQQTQAPRVVDFFVKFMQRFPSVDVLAGAQWEEVMEYVRGLGYYRRFRNLIVAAKVVMSDFGGNFPREYADLRRLPGVGEYTAGAVLAFACGKDVIALDTNVRQVLKKFFGEELSDVELKKIAGKACPRGSAREFYQGMMDYNAGEMRKMSLTKNANAKMKKIVVRNIALNQREKSGLGIPVIKVAAGVIWRKRVRGTEVLIQTRVDSGNKIYEFPGGKIEARETQRACLKRELMEELGIEAAVRPAFLKTEFSFGDKVIQFSWHRCQILLGEPSGLDGQIVKWISIAELEDYSFPPSNDEVILALRG